MTKFSIKNIKYLIFICSLVFIGFGIVRGEVAVVLNKAVNVCLECIGIG